MSQNLAKIILGIIFTSTILWAPFKSNAQEIIPNDDLKEFETLSKKEKAQTCRFYSEASNLPKECSLAHSTLDCMYKDSKEKKNSLNKPTVKDGVCILDPKDQCSIKKEEIQNFCNTCLKGNSETKAELEGEEKTCGEYTKIINPKEVVKGVTCNKVSTLVCSQANEKNTTPTILKPFDSEFFNVNDNNSGLNATGQNSSFETETTGGGPLLGPIFRIINFLVAIISTLTIFGIVYGSFTLVTSGGDDNRITKGKDIIKNSIIALVIVMASYTLVRVTQAIVFNLVN